MVPVRDEPEAPEPLPHPPYPEYRPALLRRGSRSVIRNSSPWHCVFSHAMPMLGVVERTPSQRQELRVRADALRARAREILGPETPNYAIAEALGGGTRWNFSRLLTGKHEPGGRFIRLAVTTLRRPDERIGDVFEDLFEIEAVPERAAA